MLIHFSYFAPSMNLYNQHFSKVLYIYWFCRHYSIAKLNGAENQPWYLVQIFNLNLLYQSVMKYCNIASMKKIAGILVPEG